MYSTLYNVPMAGTLQTLILTSPTTKTPSLRHRSQYFPSNRALFHIPSITFNRDRSFRRPITALDRSDQVRPPPIPFLSITCFSYLFGYRENVGKKIKSNLQFPFTSENQSSKLVLEASFACCLIFVCFGS